MSMLSHIAELSRRHKALDKEIEHAKATPAAEDVKLTELKRKKLALKDEIAKLKH